MRETESIQSFGYRITGKERSPSEYRTMFQVTCRELTLHKSVVRVDHYLRRHWHLKIDERPAAE
jgi:hypothetical protein